MARFALPGSGLFVATLREWVADEPVLLEANWLTTRPLQGLLDELGIFSCTVEPHLAGEPDVEGLAALWSELSLRKGRPLVALGGGSVLDAAKFLSVMTGPRVERLWEEPPTGRRTPVWAVPATPGTGSEWTSVAVAGFPSEGVKRGLASPWLVPERAVLIPELLERLPDRAFASAHADALVHALEAWLSPEGNPFSEGLAREAVRLLHGAWRHTETLGGLAAWRQERVRFLWGSTLAGMAFSVSGVGTVHALAYPLGGACHVPHGQANASLLLPVLDHYARSGWEGWTAWLDDLEGLLGVASGQALARVERWLGGLGLELELNPGQEAPPVWARQVWETQQRLLSRAPIPLGEEDLLRIYRVWLLKLDNDALRKI